VVFEIKGISLLSIVCILGVLTPFVLREARRIIDDRYQPDAYHIEMNCGEAAGQSIPHFHCHLIPRYQGDSIQAETTHRNLT